MRYYFIPPRTTVMKKRKEKKSWNGGYGEKEFLGHSWWYCNLSKALWKTVERFLKKFKVQLPYDLHSHVQYRTIQKSQEMETTSISIV